MHPSRGGGGKRALAGTVEKARSDSIIPLSPHLQRDLARRQ